MRRLLLAACLLLWAWPASAALSVGAITNSNTATAAGATIAVSPLSDLTIGDIVLVYCGAHTTGIGASGGSTTMSITDTDGHTYTRLSERSVNVSTDDHILGLFITTTTAVISTGDAITCNTGNASSLGKTIEFIELNATSGYDWVNDGANGQSASGSSSYTAVGVTGLSNISRLWVGVVQFAHTSGTINCATSYTCLSQKEADNGTAAQSINWRLGYLVQTVTGDDYDGTLSTTRNYGALVVALDEVLIGSAATRPAGILLGVF